ncbi:MAG: molybdopterin oxidoreductase family protein, partial [Candidatus Dormibacteraeota bacterium]|nr:molybdopterin oxidoreductase family protein [Candidatus Dormibacteraeota bacterium]
RCLLVQDELAGLGLDTVPGYTPRPEEGPYPLVMVSAKTALHFLNSSYTMLPRHARREPPLVQVDPDDADRRGIATGDRVRVFNERGSIELEAQVGREVRPGVVSIPHGHWRSLSGGSANDLTSDGLADLGGGGDFYGTRVEVVRVP